jgi:RhoGEF domain
MNYPPIPPKNTPPAPPKRRPTYGEYHGTQYNDDFNSNNYGPPPPRRKPVSLVPRTSTVDDTGSRQPHQEDVYAAPPVSGRRNTLPVTYDWPPGQQSGSGYTEPKTSGGLVYPEEFIYEHPTPPPTKNQFSSYDARFPATRDDLYEEEFDDIPPEVNANYRPLPPRPEPPSSPYPPKLQVSPYEEQYDRPVSNQRVPVQSPEIMDDPFQDPFPRRPIRRSPSNQNISDYLEMPTPVVTSPPDTLHPLPPTPKSPPYTHQPQAPDVPPALQRQGSGQRPGTRSSTSSMYSYTQDQPIENEFIDYEGNEYDPDYVPSAGRLRATSFGRSGTILSAPRNPSYTALRVETDDIEPPPLPPPPPQYVQLSTPSPPRGHAQSASFSSSSSIYRSRTEPGHSRTLSNEPFAPPPPPKLPLTEGHPKQPPLGVSRSQSHSVGLKAVTRNLSHPAKVAQELLLAPEESPLTPITDSKSFPLSSKTFQRCKEPWSLSALRIWIQEVFGSSVSMETISLALQGLFTHHVSTLSIHQADKLAAQVGTTWVHEGILFEPTIANTALWNPLSTLELGFTPLTLEGVIPTLTGKGCYSKTCATTPPGVGRCYSHLCSRTLVRKPTLPLSPTLPTSPGPGRLTDWTSFWNLDSEFLRTLEKREIKRQNVIFEFIQAEEEYVADLTTMLNFQKQLIHGSSAASGSTPIISPDRLDEFTRVVFGNVKPILDWQSKKLMVPLRERQALQGPVVRGVGDIVLEWVRGCGLIYGDYAGGYPSADILVREETASNALFASWLEVKLTLCLGMLIVAITSRSCVSATFVQFLSSRTQSKNSTSFIALL